MRRRRARRPRTVVVEIAGGAAPLVASLLALALVGGCAHVVEPGIAFQPGNGRYDFSRPLDCQTARAVVESPSDDQVVVRYLGAGGLFVGWRGEALLIGPFFSNPGALRVGLGHVRWREDAIEEALEPLRCRGPVGAILAGHSHYDHIGDLPVIARDWAPGASLVLNRSGKAALEPYPALSARIQELEAIENDWTRLANAEGTLLPFRLLALPSDHAPHVGGMLVMDGETQELRKDWRRTRYWKLRTGRTYAFLLDLLGEAEGGGEPPVRFRILYQDAAATGLSAALPRALASGPPVDLAVLCMPSAHLVPPYPGRVLGASRPDHALIIHYESFFRPWGRSAPFAPFLTRERAEGFLNTVETVLRATPPARAGAPATMVGTGSGARLCGPSSERWTMPLVGEWLVFDGRPPP